VLRALTSPRCAPWKFSRAAAARGEVDEGTIPSSSTGALRRRDAAGVDRQGDAAEGDAMRDGVRAYRESSSGVHDITMNPGRRETEEEGP
jgi:hypothetical protein